MLTFHLNDLSSEELFKDVLVRLVNGDELTLNYFELKSRGVEIPSHGHPVEHLVLVLDGELEFMFGGEKTSLKEKKGLFLSANTLHSARVIQAPVKALEIFIIAEDRYYEKSDAK